MQNVLHILHSTIEWIVMYIPGTLGRSIRYSYYKRRVKSMGTNVIIDVGVRFVGPEFVSIGENTWIDNYVVILAGPALDSAERAVLRKPNPAYKYSEGEIVIGKNCHIANFVVLQGHGGLSIGDDSGVASGSMLYSLSHHYRRTDGRDGAQLYKFSPMAQPAEQSLIASPVVMEASTALGLGSIMLPGAIVHEGSWVGVRSVVTEAIPPFSIAAGNPAKVVSERSN